MTIEEQKKIAYDQGRLAAWLGQVHRQPSFLLNDVLFVEWERGAADQCKVMSESASKIPLVFRDQRNARGQIRAD